MRMKSVLVAVMVATLPLGAIAKDLHAGDHVSVPDEVIAQQRAELLKNTQDQGYGPQSPRDIGSVAGTNKRLFGPAPAHTEMNLCDIHFHKNAEHKGGEFTTYAGNGDGRGYMTGFRYSGTLTEAESAPVEGEICPSDHGSLKVGDTIEVHYVFSSAQAVPGPSLGTCLTDAIKNPQLRVMAQVLVLVNDERAADFVELTKYGLKDGLYQALNIPENTGAPVQYTGSTTGPAYNETGSPFQVSWSVRPKVLKVNAESVGRWCQGNDFNEDHAHGVRTLVIEQKLLSEIQR